tara:strand:- start:4776 stop:5684 length:909 start_codon:yes stop_codon:yes gene_type:complete
MLKLQLLRLLASVLGKGLDKNHGNHWYKCPYCKHHKEKLSINVTNQKWQCWVCGKKGRKIINIFKSLNINRNKILELGTLLKENVNVNALRNDEVVSLPMEYQPLSIIQNTPDYRNAINYIRKRNLDKYDILRYSIGYAESGPYSGMIIIPSFNDDGVLNYFTSRAYYETDFKHKNPKVSKDIVGYDLFINWREPIVLVEGSFDAIAVGDNAIPIFGKIIGQNLKKKIIEKSVKDLFIILDQDAKDRALQHVKYFMDNGVNVYFVNLPDKDPSELGKEKIRALMNSTNKMTFGKLMEYKLYE